MAKKIKAINNKGKNKLQEKKDNKGVNNLKPVFQKKDRRINDKEVQKYEELLNKKTHRPKKEKKVNKSKKKVK